MATDSQPAPRLRSGSVHGTTSTAQLCCKARCLSASRCRASTTSLTVRRSCTIARASEPGLIAWWSALLGLLEALWCWYARRTGPFMEQLQLARPSPAHRETKPTSRTIVALPCSKANASPLAQTGSPAHPRRGCVAWTGRAVSSCRAIRPRARRRLASTTSPLGWHTRTRAKILRTVKLALSLVRMASCMKAVWSPRRC
mmetsp:Transcript_60302/g.158030  ORF Transcript_60302/g.158030 Transcript_60302/m.158030 type:complete len:200 (+) Transcript_60302:1462-2061(+)